MTEFNNNNPNPGDSRDNDRMNSQNQYNKAPEYSFWAEQVPSNPNPYLNNQGTNTWQNGNPAPNMNQNQNQTPDEPQKKKRKGSGGKVIRFLTKAVCFGLIAGAVFIGLQKLVVTIDPNALSVGFINSAGDQDNKDYQVNYTQAATVKTADRSVITEVADNTLPSIVSINCSSTQTVQDFFGGQQSQDVESSGSGIIVSKDSKELLIATNNHVVEGANEISVTFKDGSKETAVIKGTDTTADLAVISVDISDISADTLTVITVAKLGNSDSIKVGEMAVAIGNALGYGQSVTVGYISAKDREIDVSDGYNGSKKMTFLQTDAAINPGNSGGALINMQGEVVGINTIKYASDEVEGMGYAIPISSATPIIKELMSREILSAEEQGYLGIGGYDVTEDVSSYYNIPVGVYISEIYPGSASEQAGLKAEDVITKADDIEITSITQLAEYVNSKKVGTEVKITYMRNTDGEYKEATVTVTLGKNPKLGSTKDDTEDSTNK
jgi:serine protease Do